ncbi:hypothetical protein D3C80_1542010 [compost metagenome]
MVHGGQADVLVRPAVAGNVVRVEQLVVIGQVLAARAHFLRIANIVVAIRLRNPGDDDRLGIVGNVVEETMPSAHGAGQADRFIAVALDQLRDVIRRPGYIVSAVTDAYYHLRHAVRPADEVAICIGGQ